MNKFEQVSSDGHQISLAGYRSSPCTVNEVPCPEGAGCKEAACTERSNELWVIVVKATNLDLQLACRYLLLPILSLHRA